MVRGARPTPDPLGDSVADVAIETNRSDANTPIQTEPDRVASASVDLPVPPPRPKHLKKISRMSLTTDSEKSLLTYQFV